MKRTLLLLVAAATLAACVPRSPQYVHVRGSDDPSVDDPALSMDLDRRDLYDVLDQTLADLMYSRFLNSDADRGSTIAISPFLNTTHHDIDDQLDALLSRMETTLVRDQGRLQVVSIERRADLRAERFEQQDPIIFDIDRSVSMARERGAHFLLTGKIYEADEVVGDMERVQYFLTLQVLDVETGVIRWQADGDLTKALVPMDG